MAKRFSELHHKRWNNFTLGELQLIQLGLWVLGEENRVDFKLVGDHLRLRTQLKVALERRVAESGCGPREKEK